MRLASGECLLRHFRSVTDTLGEGKLGCKSSDIGTYSMRSGESIAMFLDNIPVFLIMLVGRWSSESFLDYIRKHVLETCTGISSRTIKNDMHHALPSPSLTIDDPRSRNRDSFASSLSSMALTSNRLQAMRPVFSLYH